jgi:hypothetical protein
MHFFIYSNISAGQIFYDFGAVGAAANVVNDCQLNFLTPDAPMHPRAVVEESPLHYFENLSSKTKPIYRNKPSLNKARA